MLPEEFRSSSIAGLLKKAQKVHADDYIQQAISYSLEKSTRRTSSEFKSFLGRCLDEGWAIGFESTRQEEQQDKDKLFLDSRRLMPDAMLIQDAGLGCLVSAQILHERGLDSGR